MHVLDRKEDPTGFLNLFRLASMDRFGDPKGHIQGRGRWPNGTKKGPGRRHARITDHEWTETLPTTAYERNPVIIEEVRRADGSLREIRRDGPVRMKLPRLRRCAR